LRNSHDGAGQVSQSQTATLALNCRGLIDRFQGQALERFALDSDLVAAFRFIDEMFALRPFTVT
jgi:hypothetical protein